MDARVQSFLDKLRTMADKTSQAASNAADAAGKKAGELAGATRLNLQIFDLDSECEALYKEIGKLVYDLHRGAETPEDAIDEKIAALDARHVRRSSARTAAGHAAARIPSARAAAASCERIFCCALPYRKNRTSKGRVAFAAKKTEFRTGRGHPDGGEPRGQGDRRVLPDPAAEPDRRGELAGLRAVQRGLPHLYRHAGDLHGRPAGGAVQDGRGGDRLRARARGAADRARGGGHFRPGRPAGDAGAALRRGDLRRLDPQPGRAVRGHGGRAERAHGRGAVRVPRLLSGPRQHDADRGLPGHRGAGQAGGRSGPCLVRQAAGDGRPAGRGDGRAGRHDRRGRGGGLYARAGGDHPPARRAGASAE